MLSVRTARGEESLSLAEFETRIRNGDIAASHLVRFSVLTGDRWVKAGELELFRRLYEPARIHFRRRFALGRFPGLTLFLVFAQAVVFFGLAGTESHLHLDQLISAGAKMPAHVFELGETWRLITANFLHRDVLHLFFNMIFFFNMGATIENAYRKQDYVLILVGSALGTTIVSALMSSQASVGASGIVLGFFGAASVFGYRYSDILPRKYRRYFTGIILPYALFILYVGLSTAGTDNWGHLGGLVSGAVIAFFLNPSLLHLGEKKQSLVTRWVPALVSVLLVSIVLGGGIIIRHLGVPMQALVEHDSGLRLNYPSRWHLGTNHLAYPARGNGLGVSLGVRVRRESQNPINLIEAKRRFIEDELQRTEKSGAITSVRILEERSREVPGGRAMEIVASLDSRVGSQLTRNLIIERGYLSYYIVLSAPLEWSHEYAPLLEEIISSVHLFDPDSLIQARRRVEIFPGMPSTHVSLGEEFAHLGMVPSARSAFRQALTLSKNHHGARYGLAKLAFDYGGDLKSAEKITLQLYRDNDENLDTAILLANIRWRQGDMDAALGVLRAGLTHSPSSLALKTRIKELMAHQEKRP